MGLARPSAFAWFSRDYITAGLALTMLAMGTSLKLSVSTAASSADGGSLDASGSAHANFKLRYVLVSLLHWNWV